MQDRPPIQLELPLDEAPVGDGGANVEGLENVIQFAEALKVQQEKARQEAIRNILNLREEVQEG